MWIGLSDSEDLVNLQKTNRITLVEGDGVRVTRIEYYFDDESSDVWECFDDFSNAKERFGWLKRQLLRPGEIIDPLFNIRQGIAGDLVSVREATEITGRSDSFIYKLIRDGDLSAVKDDFKLKVCKSKLALFTSKRVLKALAKLDSKEPNK